MTNIYTIYRATCLINNKCYVGFDSKWPRRKKEHLYHVGKACGMFSKALAKHGVDNFVWEILYQSLDGDHTLNVIEGYFIKENNSFAPGGYNLTLGGDGCLGYIKSAEIRAKHGAANRGKTRCLEQRVKMSEAAKNRSPEVQTKIAKSRIGRKHTAEHKAQIVAKHQKPISTPFGIFISSKHACDEINIYSSVVHYRLNSPNFPEWNYLNKNVP